MKKIRKIIQQLQCNQLKCIMIKSIALVFMISVFAYIFFSELIIYLVRNKVVYSYTNSQVMFSNSIARIINGEIERKHQLLIKVSDQLSGLENSNESPISIINRHSHLLSIFNNGLFLFNYDGRLLYELPIKPNRINLNFSYRSYFSETIKQKKGIISQPYISSLPHSHPCIMFTAPIYDKKGNIVSVLGGSLDLISSNFLNDIFSIKHLDYAYFMLMTADGRVIYHPNKKFLYSKVKNPDKSSFIQIQDLNNEWVSRVSNVIEYPNWILHYNIQNKQVIYEMISNKKIIYHSVFLVVFGTFVLVLFIFIKVYHFSIIMSKKLSFQELSSNIDLPLKEKGPGLFKANIKKINETVMLYKDLFKKYEASRDEFIKIFTNSNLAFVAYNENNACICQWNKPFLSLLDTDETSINNMPVHQILFQDHKLYQQPFNDFIDELGYRPNKKDLIIFNKKKESLRCQIHAFRITLKQVNQIILIIQYLPQTIDFQSEYIMTQSINLLLLEQSKQAFHIADVKGKITQFSPEFKNRFSPNKKIKEVYIWDLLITNKDLIELQQFFNSLKTFKQERKQFYINIKNERNHLINLSSLTYYPIRNEQNEITYLVGIIE